MKKDRYGWQKADGIYTVYLAIPKMSDENTLRHHTAIYDPSDKMLELIDGADWEDNRIAYFKVKNKKQAEEIILTFRGILLKKTSN